jgi:hypothetical protein
MFASQGLPTTTALDARKATHNGSIRRNINTESTSEQLATLMLIFYVLGTVLPMRDIVSGGLTLGMP